MPLDKGGHDHAEEALLRLIRTANEALGSDMVRIDEEAITAYVMGTANPGQEAVIQSALARSAEFRNQLLELMRASVVPATADEQGAFSRAIPPTIEEIQRLAAFARRLERQQATADAKTTVRSTPRRRRMEWILGGWAAAATVVAGGLIVVMTQSPRTVPPPFVAHPVPGPPEPVPGSFDLEVVDVISLRGPSRGTEPAPPPVIMIPATAKTVYVRAEAPDLPEGSLVRLSLQGPGGSILVRDSLRIEDLFMGKALALHSQNGFQHGVHVLTIAGARAGAPDSVSYAFSIEIANQRTR